MNVTPTQLLKILAKQPRFRREVHRANNPPRLRLDTKTGKWKKIRAKLTPPMYIRVAEPGKKGVKSKLVHDEGTMIVLDFDAVTKKLTGIEIL